MIITSKITMDLQNPGISPRICAVQTDRYSRDLQITLYAGDAPFPVPDNTAVMIRYRKSDGKGGEYDSLPDGRSAWSIHGNILTVALAPQVLTFPGSVDLSVSLICGGRQLSLLPIDLQVEPLAFAPIAKSENYFYVTGLLPAPANATVGQYLQVAAVDETGKVTILGTDAPQTDAAQVRQIVDSYMTENPPASGVTPELSIGTVETLSPDADATASITGSAEKPVLNLGIPGSSVKVPDYWLDALTSGAESINRALLAAGSDKSAFLFYTDAHWDEGGRKAPALLKHLWYHTGMRKTVFGGDIVSTEATDYATMAYLWQWRKEIKDLPNHHSVAGNHDDGNATDHLFTPEYLYGYLMAAEESNDLVRGGDTYYYTDDPSEKTRYLYLDTGYDGLSAISDAQAAFITEALKQTPAGWHIVVISHIWYVPDYDQYHVRPIPVVGLSSSAATVCSILDSYNARSGEFADCGARVEFCIGGHVHIDYVGATEGGIPIILCETASQNVRSTFPNTVGTDSETAVSGIVANYTTDKVYVIRIGRGNSFEVDLSSSIIHPDVPEVPNYTNVLETVGFVEGKRLSGGDGTERDNAGTDVTGFIPCTANTTFYLKNVTMPDTSDNYYAFVARYDANKTFLGGYYVNSSTDCIPLYDDNGNLIRFSLFHSDYAFIRICAQNIDASSIITVNEVIE